MKINVDGLEIETERKKIQSSNKFNEHQFYEMLKTFSDKDLKISKRLIDSLIEHREKEINEHINSLY